MVAVTDIGPERHVKEDSVNFVVAYDFLDASHDVVAVGRIWADDAVTAFRPLVVAFGGKNPPVRMMFEIPIIENDAEIGEGMNLLAAALSDYFTEKVPAVHIGMPLANVGLPKAKTDMRIRILHHGLESGAGDVANERRGIKVAEKFW